MLLIRQDRGATAIHQTAVGKLIGIAARPERRVPMVTFDEAHITIDTGVYGDHGAAELPAGRGFMGDLSPSPATNRALTILSREAWDAAIADVSDCGAAPWTERRANLLVEGLDLRMARGSLITIGHVMVEVTRFTFPCKRMDEVCSGLLKALAKDQRGGLTCRVLEPGHVALGDDVTIVKHVPIPNRRLP